MKVPVDIVLGINAVVPVVAVDGAFVDLVEKVELDELVMTDDEED